MMRCEDRRTERLFSYVICEARAPNVAPHHELQPSRLLRNLLGERDQEWSK